jgi:predicted nucleic acid-binding protein
MVHQHMDIRARWRWSELTVHYGLSCRRPTPAIEQRALEIHLLLADRGRHRAPAIPDLLIAAVAERAGHTVLHVDKDFELIAEVTRQPVERLR